MPNKNYIKGVSFEVRFLKQLLEKGIAVKGARFYASKGVTDVWWVDKKGRHNEAQLKFSAKKPYIAAHEIQNLKKFARETKDVILVWLVLKQSRKPYDMRLII